MHDKLLSILSADIGELQDNRKYSNALKYDIGDIVFGAFSVFYTGLLTNAYPCQKMRFGEIRKIN